MKFFSAFRSPAIIIGLALLTGCAGHIKQLPDGRYLSATTAGDTLDRSATYVQILEKKESGYQEVAGDLTVGQTVAGQATVGILNGTGAAAIQARAARDVAKIKASAYKCPDGALNCQGTVISVGGAQASAGAEARSQSDLVFDAVIGGVCPNGDCVAVPMQ